MSTGATRCARLRSRFRMDAQIHGALVGGALAGGVVLVGVVTAEWLTRMRERRARIQEAVQRLAMVLPHVTSPISAVWIEGTRPSTTIGSQWNINSEVCMDLLGAIQ